MVFPRAPAHEGRPDAVSAAEPPEARLTTRSGLALGVGPLRHSERHALFALFSGVVERGEGYPQSPPLTQEDFEASFGRAARAVVVARVGDELAGAYYLKPNFPGRAGHIANAGYLVDPRWRGRGVARVLVEDSLERARQLGFDAMLFNLVFESNPARRLYEELGFTVTGRVPAAVEGEDALVYWRPLGTGPP